jgi:hypothetical protein
VISDDEIAGQVDWLRTWGRCAKLGIPLEPPRLPRSRKLRSAVEQAAETDTRVRLALDEIERAERERPGVIHRHVGPANLFVY